MVAVGTKDLAAGLEFLKEIENDYSVNFLSANLINTVNKSPLFKPYKKVSINGITAAVIGLTGLPAQNLKQDATILHWHQILPDVLTELSKSVEMIILLSNFSASENRKIAEEHPSVHLIFQSGNTASNRNPQLVNNSLICQTNNRGQYQGIIDIQWNNTGKWRYDVTRKLKKQKKRQKKVIMKITELEKVPQLNEAQLERLNSLKKYHSQLTKDLNELQAKQQETASGAKYSNRFIALSGNVANDVETSKLMK